MRLATTPITSSHPGPSTLVACPDARPPAYQAVTALSEAGLLDEFVTAYYYSGVGLLPALARSLAPNAFARVERTLQRRRCSGIPSHRVRSHASFDLVLRVENRIGHRGPFARRQLARWRTDRFDQALANRVRGREPGAVLVFSDVGSGVTLPMCRRRGIPSLLSMVHGDVREEIEVVDREAERSPEFLCMYLADGPVDRGELSWIHQRRLRDIELADRILVPSDHIARQLVRHGTPVGRVRVVPYAADTSRFLPARNKPHRKDECTFLFAGGITQRKGVKYLLEAWRRVRRPGWRLQLLGGLPADPSPLEPYQEDVEWLGRVGHADVPALMARADVFVFPSLFEGSAVVTYEAMACGLPSIVTSESGSVARDGIEALIVPAGEVEPLAHAMERLGLDSDLRADFSQAARARAESFDWPRYHRAIVEAVSWLEGSCAPHRLAEPRLVSC